MSEGTEVIGIDFGTTHTHVSIGSAISKESRSFGKGWPSAVLYWNGDYSGCGDEALEEFVDYAHDGHYDLRVNFKPEIEHDKEAGETAALFLREITHDIPDKTSMKTLVGVPAGASEGFKDALKKLMSADFGDVETISEPLGALVNFQESGRLPNRELIDDLLVIDFGGGTCDFAYTRGGKVHSVPLEKGNYYGGRLFDDMFFQWWEESNPSEAQQCPESDKAIIFQKNPETPKKHFLFAWQITETANSTTANFLNMARCEI
jgi:molecular chaperone DnaK (HSP70)